MGKAKRATPTAYQVKVSTAALQHIQQITGYIAFIQRQPLNAIRIGDAIDETIRRIALNPTAFREVEELRTASRLYRRAICRSWSIVFRIRHDEILILGIIHTASRSSKFKSLKRVV